VFSNPQYSVKTLKPLGIQVGQGRLHGRVGRVGQVGWVFLGAITFLCFRRKTLKHPKKKKQKQARNSKINRSTSTRNQKSLKRENLKSIGNRPAKEDEGKRG
jgi:hypothetical protein